MLTAPSGSGGTAASHKAPATPFGKLQLTTPIKTTRATATAAAARRNGTADDKSPEVSPGGGATSPLAKLGIHTPKDKLTGRPQPDSLQVCTHLLPFDYTLLQTFAKAKWRHMCAQVIQSVS